MVKLILFGIISIPLVIISRKNLFSPQSHGFYRFISWECIAWLFASNYVYWFHKPLSVVQVISWSLLVISLYLLIAGVFQLKKARRETREREEKGLFKFEKTSELITTGIFHYIRHPLYASLLYLTWGILLKNITAELLIISGISTISLFVTALIDEKECKKYFGDQYYSYMKTTTRFIPFII